MTEGTNCSHQISLCMYCAWAEAEAALPEGWKLSQVSRTNFAPERRWLAWATGYEPGEYLFCYGASLAAALRALSAQLREWQP